MDPACAEGERERAYLAYKDRIKVHLFHGSCYMSCQITQL
jgi:hypothetical protein